LTLAQFDALGKRYLEERKQLDYRAALVCSILAETNRDRKKRTKAYTPADFMPKQRTKRVKITNEKIAEKIKDMNTILGGDTK